MNIGVSLVFLMLIIFPVIVICGIVMAVAGRRSTTKEDPEQARMIQEIYHGLERMEQRVDALETILFDSERKEHRR